MVGWMDDEALHRTLTTGRATYWSRSRAASTGSRARPPATGSGSRTSGSTATATPCSSRSTRRVRPATPATAPASTRASCRCRERRAAGEGPHLRPDRAGRPGGCRTRRRGGSASDWATATGRQRRGGGLGCRRRRPSAPLALALSLVALAAWGVLLVLRGRVRRLVAALGVVAAAGVVLATVAAFARRGTTPSSRRRRRVRPGGVHHLAHRLVLGHGGGRRALHRGARGRRAQAPGWPAMGTRYDTPRSRGRPRRHRARTSGRHWTRVATRPPRLQRRNDAPLPASRGVLRAWLTTATPPLPGRA